MYKMYIILPPLMKYYQALYTEYKMQIECSQNKYHVGFSWIL